MLYPIITYSRNLGDFSIDLEELYKAGLKAIRLIYKGKTEAEFNLRINEIQKLIKEKEINLDIIIDLPGNKPTVGNFKKGLDVKAGAEYHLVDQAMEPSNTNIPTINFLSHKSFSNLCKGDIISLADDELNLKVKDIQKTIVVCEAINDYHLTSNRSISVKDHPFNYEANSDRDIQFVNHLQNKENNIKLLVSFCKRASDILSIKAIQPTVGIMAKVENIIDDANLLEIINCSESILLGRGDLSTAYPANEIFKFQKRVIEHCKSQNKQLIIGTGLLNGIGDKLTPSIAEIMDYSYLRTMGIDTFLITGTNATHQPFKTLEFMHSFE